MNHIFLAGLRRTSATTVGFARTFEVRIRISMLVVPSYLFRRFHSVRSHVTLHYEAGRVIANHKTFGQGVHIQQKQDPLIRLVHQDPAEMNVLHNNRKYTPNATGVFSCTLPLWCVRSFTLSSHSLRLQIRSLRLSVSPMLQSLCIECSVLRQASQVHPRSAWASMKRSDLFL